MRREIDRRPFQAMLHRGPIVNCQAIERQGGTMWIHTTVGERIPAAEVAKIIPAADRRGAPVDRPRAQAARDPRAALDRLLAQAAEAAGVMTV
jgi:hypothetical protein